MPETSPAHAAPLPRTRRVVLGTLDLLTGLAAAGLASLLWSSTGVVTTVLMAWAGVQLASALALWIGAPWARAVVRVSALVQLLVLVAVSIGLLASASYLWGLYGEVGTGIAVLLMVIVALLVELLGLLPIYKIRFVGLSPRWTRLLPWLGAGVVVATLFGCGATYGWGTYPEWTETTAADREKLGKAVLATATGTPTSTPSDVESALYVVRVFDRGRQKGRVAVRGDATEVVAAAKTMPRIRVRPAVVVDKVVASGPMVESIKLLAALSVVPGLDGVTGIVDGRVSVVLPQELVAGRLLTSETPLPFVRDFKAGVSLEEVRRLLCANAGKSRACHVTNLERIRTESWVVHGGTVTPLERGRPERDATPIRQPEARKGAIAGGEYVLRALQLDGRYTYKLRPITGRELNGSYSIPRHAGTSWFLLVLARETGDQRYLHAAEKALVWLEKRLADCGGFRCIATGDGAALGSQALSLIAFADHARITQSDRFGSAIRDLTQAVLTLQKDDGDFHFRWDPKAKRAVPGRRQFYAAGQAALALSMVASTTGNPKHLDAARRAMDFMAGPYWDFFAGELFFIEEHWTCLAALEAWQLFEERRHAQLCVDIGSFYRQLQHRRSETLFKDYVGGVGFSPFFPPHTTPTASRGEAMIAAYKLSVALGDEDKDVLAGVHDAVSFLRHNQFTESDTYQFADPKAAVGGVQWNYLDPTIRIDTVQHAASVMLLGGPLLEP